MNCMYVCVFVQSDCSLHLHLRYSQVVSPFYNATASKGPVSIESAPLIIIAHGEQRLLIIIHPCLVDFVF